MNEDDDPIRVTIDLGDVPVTPAEMKLLADLLPELLKDMLWLQSDEEA